VNQSLSSYTFTPNNDPETWLSQVWNGSTWVNNAKQVITYNSSNVRLNKTYQTWSAANNTWNNQSIETYTFNAYNYIDELQSNTWHPATSTYTNSSYQKYYLSCVDFTGIQENTTGALSIEVYPNPCEQLLHIKLPVNADKVKVYNLAGSLVMEQNAGESLDISHLSAGIYQLQVVHKDGSPAGSARFVRQN
jgi:hypothetical protein